LSLLIKPVRQLYVFINKTNILKQEVLTSCENEKIKLAKTSVVYHF